MQELIYQRLIDNLTELKLNNIKQVLNKYLETAVKEKTSLLEALDFLMETERIEQDEKALIMRTNVAGFPFRKTFEQYDFSFQPNIDMQMINDLRTIRFVHNRENVILLGPPGVGKTHIAIAMGMDTLRYKFSTYYINCHQLVNQLNKAHFENKLESKLKRLCSYRVLIIDELGYLPLDKQGANLLFQLVSRRYEKNTTIITSNKGFAEWGEIFGDNIIASAMLDRLLHHCIVLPINGNSYRLKDRVKEVTK